MANTFKMINGDVTINSSNGRPITITGSEKTSQDIQEFFTVDILPNGFGAGIEQLVGIVESSEQIFASNIDKQIRDGLANFIRLIGADARIPRSNVERIVGATNILVSPDSTDPTKYYFTVNIITQAGVLPFISDSIVIPV